MHEHPDDVSSRIIFVLMRKQFSEDNSSRANPARSAGAFHSTTWTFISITWKNLSPYLDKVRNLKGAQGLSGLAVVEPCHDTLRPCLRYCTSPWTWTSFVSLPSHSTDRELQPEAFLCWCNSSSPCQVATDFMTLHLGSAGAPLLCGAAAVASYLVSILFGI
jgi:hypothetical protein